VEYGFSHDDSNTNTAPFSRRAAICGGERLLKAAGNGMYTKWRIMPGRIAI
jgi:hypothetical protein